MANNDQLLEQMRKVVREEVKAETEPIKRDMATWREVASVKKDVQDMKQDIANVKQTQGQQKTMLEAVLAGQQELQETVATRADIQDLKATLTKKVHDHESRIEELEKIESIPHPHKH